jgi:hypothetical protein
MAIRFTNAVTEPKRVVRTRSVTAPLDSRGANDALPKIAEALPKLSNNGNAKKRGRPISGNALTAAEKQRRYRERKRLSSSGSSSSP